MRKTKIVCTIGPASSSPEIIGALLDAGMNVVRLNFSHGAHEEHSANIEHVREAARERDRSVPIIADLQGPKIRTGPLPGDDPVELKAGNTVCLTGGDAPSSATEISIDYSHLAHEVRKGDRILLDDGSIELAVDKTEGDAIRAKVVTGGLLRARKGVNVPGAALRLPALTDKDKDDLQFALKHNVDFVAQSFVRRGEDVRELKQAIQDADSDAHVIAKLEKPQALDDLTQILKWSDGVMVARGDLGVELSPWRVPVEQKRIIAEAAKARKPVITATQMLQSMIERPSPTRAEASDVANAVFDGSDALMLSGETAVGRYPVGSVTMMTKIIETAEAALPGDAEVLPIFRDAENNLSGAVARSAARLSEDLGARYIVVYTESGYTARLISKHRPRCSILALSRHEPVCRKLKLLWGVRTRVIGQVEDLDELVATAESLMLKLQWVRKEDLICVVAGTPFRVSGKTDLIKLHLIGH